MEIHPKFGVYLQDLRLIPTKRLLYLIGFAANTGNSSIFHTFLMNMTLNLLNGQNLYFDEMKSKKSGNEKRIDLELEYQK